MIKILKQKQVTLTVQIKHKSVFFTVDQFNKGSRVPRNYLTEHMEEGNTYTFIANEATYKGKLTYVPVSFNPNYYEEIQDIFDEVKHQNSIAYAEKQIMWIEKNLSEYWYTNGYTRAMRHINGILERDKELARSMEYRLLDLQYIYLTSTIGSKYFLIDLPKEQLEIKYKEIHDEFNECLSGKSEKASDLSCRITYAFMEIQNLCVYLNEFMQMKKKLIDLKYR